MRAFGISVCAVLVGAVLHTTLANRMELFGARPDFYLLFGLLLSLYLPPNGATVLGFFLGLFQGVLAGANLWQSVFSRMLPCYIVRRSRGEENPDSLVVALVVVALGTFLAQLFYMFVAPPASVPRYLLLTLGTTCYNCVLTLPAYPLIRICMGLRSSGV